MPKAAKTQYGVLIWEYTLQATECDDRLKRRIWWRTYHTHCAFRGELQ